MQSNCFYLIIQDLCSYGASVHDSKQSVKNVSIAQFNLIDVRLLLDYIWPFL